MKYQLKRIIIMLFSTLPLTSAFAQTVSAANRTSKNPFHILYISSYSYSWGMVPLQIEWVRFIVRDNGIGMSPEFCTHAFKAFEQEDAVNAHLQNQGTGLGLTICTELVELMGGSISLKSERNKGTEFTVDLPLKKAELPAEKIVENRQRSVD
ncbi:MAG: ATP-binding protein [Lachnospiraceae bacterium]|nr:ATP-binding protein [Lachnospiraceae bacterium]